MTFRERLLWVLSYLASAAQLFEARNPTDRKPQQKSFKNMLNEALDADQHARLVDIVPRSSDSLARAHLARAGHEGYERAINDVAKESSLSTQQVRHLSAGPSALKFRKITALVKEAQSNGLAHPVAIHAFDRTTKSGQTACWMALYDELASRGFLPMTCDGRVDRPALAWLVATQLLPELQVPYKGIVIPGRDCFRRVFGVSADGKQVDSRALSRFGADSIQLRTETAMEARDLCRPIWAQYIDKRIKEGADMDGRPPPSLRSRLSPHAPCHRCKATHCVEHCACLDCEQQCSSKPRGHYVRNDGKPCFRSQCGPCGKRECPAGKQAKLKKVANAAGQKRL